MSTLSLRIPDSLHRTLKIVVEQEGVSISQFVSFVVAEKLAALQTLHSIAEETARGSDENFCKATASKTIIDPVIAEVRAIKREIVAEHGGDLHSLFTSLQQREFGHPRLVKWTDEKRGGGEYEECRSAAEDAS